MKNSLAKAIRVIAFIMFFGGIIMLFVSRASIQDAETMMAVKMAVGMFTRDLSDIIFWKMMTWASVVTAVQSIFVYAFSYVVEASILYLNEKKAHSASRAA